VKGDYGKKHRFSLLKSKRREKDAGDPGERTVGETYSKKITTCEKPRLRGKKKTTVPRRTDSLEEETAPRQRRGKLNPRIREEKQQTERERKRQRKPGVRTKGPQTRKKKEVVLYNSERGRK